MGLPAPVVHTGTDGEEGVAGAGSLIEEGAIPVRTLLTAPVVLTVVSSFAFLSLSAYCMFLLLSTDPQASPERLDNLNTYTQSILAFTEALNECKSLPCSSGYMSDTADGLVNLTEQLLTDIVKQN